MESNIFLGDNLPIIKDWADKINQYKQSKRTHWVSLFINKNKALYVDSFGLEYNPQEVLSKTKDKSITHIFRIQDDDSIMCGFFCITFIEYMLAEKNFVRLYWFIFSLWQDNM